MKKLFLMSFFICVSASAMKPEQEVGVRAALWNGLKNRDNLNTFLITKISKDELSFYKDSMKAFPTELPVAKADGKTLTFAGSKLKWTFPKGAAFAINGKAFGKNSFKNRAGELGKWKKKVSWLQVFIETANAQEPDIFASEKELAVISEFLESLQESFKTAGKDCEELAPPESAKSEQTFGKRPPETFKGFGFKCQDEEPDMGYTMVDFYTSDHLRMLGKPTEKSLSEFQIRNDAMDVTLTMTEAADNPMKVINIKGTIKGQAIDENANFDKGILCMSHMSRLVFAFSKLCKDKGAVVGLQIVSEGSGIPLKKIAPGGGQK